MNYLKSIQCKILLVVVSMVLGPQLFAQSVKSIYTKVGTLNSPIIHTDKRNYNTGETVDIAGVDFLSYERVRLNVRYFDINLQQELPLSTWDVYADAKGRIAAEWQVHDVGGSGSSFIIMARGTISGAISKTEISTLAPEAGESVSISQCGNSNASPQNLTCPNVGPAGWKTGTVGSSSSRYFEGDSIAYRNVLGGLTPGHNYKWTLRYDTSKGGLNAIDYLTTFNRTITGANPCDGVAGCTLGSPTPPSSPTANDIPTDPRVTSGRDQNPATTGDNIVQIPGKIIAWGATITSVSLPTYTPVTFPAGDTSATVDIFFTATTSTAVIAWGGHISTRTNWGQSFGSVNISGSPYHMENAGLMNLSDSTSCCTSTQALSLQAAAVTASARIVIIKQATQHSTFPFQFSTTNLTPANFSLTDNSSSTNPSQVFDPINTFNVKRITETDAGPYNLLNLTCTVDVPGSPATPAPFVNLASRFVEINITSGAVVTCTFFNNFVTAASVSVSGRVFDSGGNGLPRAYVTATDSNGNPRTVMTNQFGYYSIDELEAGSGFVFNVSHKGYTFQSRFMNVEESLSNVNFHPQ